MRREFGARIKAAALKRCMDSNGVPRCEGIKHEVGPVHCNIILRAGDTFYDHDTPDGLGGEPTLENCKVLCGVCHDIKTHEHDNPRMTKADNQRKAHFGIKARKGRPLPGTKASGVKKKFDGSVERRS